jgi:putative Holliday junction resolvase
MTDSGSILALDVGDSRVGLALSSPIARISSPLKTLTRDEDFLNQLNTVIKEENVSTLVIGWPRGMNGQHTSQTIAVESFVKELKQTIDLPMYFQDEALTSKQAEAELEQRGKPYKRGDIDALAATYILEDYLHSKEKHEANNV